MLPIEHRSAFRRIVRACARIALHHRMVCACIVAPLAFAGAPLVRAPLAAQAVAKGSLTGTVLDDASNKPIANADIVMPQLNLKARSDSAGNFTIETIPAGLHTITISAEGFAAFSTRLGFADGQHIESDFGMRPGVRAPGTITLDGRAPVPVVGPLAAFEERRLRGAGRFMTRDMFEKAEGRKLPDLIKHHIPGLAIISNGGERAAATSSRGTQSFQKTPGAAGTKRECYVQVIVDGIVMYASAPGERLFNLDNVDPNQMYGLEFYTVSQTPSQFNGTGTAPCGTLLLWLRR